MSAINKKTGLNILCTCRMGAGTFEAKILPITKLQSINNVFIARHGDKIEIPGVINIHLPRILKFKIFHLLFTPVFLIYYVRKLKIDLILAYHIIPYAFFAFFTHLITKKPYVLGQTGIYIQDYMRKPILGMAIKHVIKNALYLNVPGSVSREFWIKEGVASTKINILHSTIDTDKFQPNSTIEKKYDIVFVGRLVKLKQVDLLLKSIYNLKMDKIFCKLAIVGDGVEYNNLVNLVKEYEIEDQVSFLGFRKDIISVLNSSKYMAMISNSEGLPCSLMEAMSCEVLPLSSMVGNIPDLINNKVNGFLFNDFEQTTIDKTINMAISQYGSQQDKEMRKNARQTIIDFHSHLSSIQQWKTIISKL
ncbi:MAG: glycosyltransferase [Candidatus Peribacteraceae bacterium]|nr:glycosyltransferase [Candidatus Peribacteraceae bacterium]